MKDKIDYNAEDEERAVSGLGVPIQNAQSHTPSQSEDSKNWWGDGWELLFAIFIILFLWEMGESIGSVEWIIILIILAILLIKGMRGAIVEAAKEKTEILETRRKMKDEKRKKEEREKKEAEERYRRNEEEAYNYRQKGGLTNLKKALKIYNYYEGYDALWGISIETKQNLKTLAKARIREIKIEIGKEKERLLDFKGALIDFEELELYEDAKRIRQKMQDEGKVEISQKVVQGDEVTEIKDSVLNRSNIGSGGKSKTEEIKELKELLDSGAIDDDEFKQMKKEILGK